MPIDCLPPINLQTERLVLRPASRSDAPSLLDYYINNRDHLQPWEPLRKEMFFTLPVQTRRLATMEQQMLSVVALHLLIWCPTSHKLLGECSFTNMIRGAFQACHLGFSIAAESQGQGLMREGLTAATALVFDAYGLHRIMASYCHNNVRSARLLQRLGFDTEGTARSYMKINGMWRDHVLTALIDKRWG